MPKERELNLKVAHRGMYTQLAGLDGVYQVQLGARMYVVASPLLRQLGLTAINVRKELARHGIHAFRLVPVALPGNMTPPPMHVIPVGKAARLISKMRKVDKQIADIKAIRDNIIQPDLPFGECKPALCILDLCGQLPNDQVQLAAGPLDCPPPPPPSCQTFQIPGPCGSGGVEHQDAIAWRDITIAEMQTTNRRLVEQRDIVTDLVRQRDLTIKEMELARVELVQALAIRDSRIAKMDEIYANIPPAPGVPTPEKTISARCREHVNAYVRKVGASVNVDPESEFGRQWTRDYTHVMWEWLYREFKYRAKVDIDQRYENMDPASRPSSKLDLVTKLGHAEMFHAMIYTLLPVERLKIR
jgi:hypothetical protein